MVAAADECRRIAFDAEQELAALIIIAELTADDGAVEIDARQAGSDAGAVERAVEVLPRIAAVETDIEAIPRVAHLRLRGRHRSGDSGANDCSRKIKLFQATYSLARLFIPSYAGDAT